MAVVLNVMSWTLAFLICRDGEVEVEGGDIWTRPVPCTEPVIRCDWALRASRYISVYAAGRLGGNG